MARHVASMASGFIALAMQGFALAQGPIAEPIVKGSRVIELETVATGLNQPNYLTHAGDGSGREFLIERNGQVRMIDAVGDLAATSFLDIRSRTITSGEAGLLGLAFHPGYADPTSAGFGKFYTYSSEVAAGTPDYGVPGGGSADHHSVITEWSVSAGNPNVADPGSRREVLRIAQPQGNHNGGAIAFSPNDGRLYVALGDGGGTNDNDAGHSPQGNGQDTTNVLGDILRIDPLDPGLTPGSLDPIGANGEYRIPANNPFVGPAAGADEIFAAGFRNPYRMSFDALDGRLVVGDVGQGSIEEVDLVELGENYGWRLKEGTFLFNPATGGVTPDPNPDPALTDPVLQYDHDEGVSIIGGFVYRGTELPELFGDYIFGDLNGRLFVGDLSSGEIEELVLGLDDRALGASLIGFGEDAERELYVLTTDFSPTGGTVFRIVPAVVPEPSSLLMLGGAIGALVVARRRRSRPTTL